MQYKSAFVFWACSIFLLTALNFLNSITVLSGRVTDNKGLGLHNVNIHFQGRVYNSDEDGYFSLYLDNQLEDSKITFARTGYECREVSLEEYLSERVIALARKPVEVSGIDVYAHREFSLPDIINVDRYVLSGEEFNEQSFFSFLQRISGLKGSVNPLSGEAQTVSFLGHRARHTLVLLDGIPLNSAGQDVDLSTIPFELIESVEVIKGGSSSIGGAGAIGGIISINTVSGHDMGSVKLQHSSGSFGLNRNSISIDLFQKNLKAFFLPAGIFLYLSHTEADNDFKYRRKHDNYTLKRENNEVKETDFFMSLSNYEGLFSWNYKFMLQNFFRKTPGPVNFLNIYENSRLKGNIARHNFYFIYVLGNLDLNYSISYRSNETEYDNTRAPVNFYYIRTKNSTSEFNSIFSGNYHFGLGSRAFETKHIVNLEADVAGQAFTYEEPTNPSNSLEPLSLNGRGLMLSNLNSFSMGSVIFDNQFTWRAGYSDKWGHSDSWSLAAMLTFQGSADFSLGYEKATAYSLPSFYELYWKGDMQSVGNPDLQPEESDYFSITGRVESYGNKLKITYHRSRIKNLIHWYRTIGGWKPANMASAEIRNYEFESILKINKSFFFNNSLLITEALNKTRYSDGSPSDFYDKKITYTPEYIYKSNFVFVTSNLIRDYDEFSASVIYQFTGRQHTTFDQLVRPLAAYGEFGSTFNYRFLYDRYNFFCQLNLNNINNKSYEIFAYTPNPGFNWELMLGLKYKFILE